MSEAVCDICKAPLVDEEWQDYDDEGEEHDDEGEELGYDAHERCLRERGIIS